MFLFLFVVVDDGTNMADLVVSSSSLSSAVSAESSQQNEPPVFTSKPQLATTVGVGPPIPPPFSRQGHGRSENTFV